MMSILHLLWIVPLVATIGFVTCAVLAANARAEEREQLCGLVERYKEALRHD